jgi:hypothetical protein
MTLSIVTLITSVLSAIEQSITFFNVMLSVTMQCCYAECRYCEGLYAECLYAECRNAECHHAKCCYAEWHYAECLYSECLYAECRYAVVIVLSVMTPLIKLLTAILKSTLLKI